MFPRTLCVFALIVTLFSFRSTLGWAEDSGGIEATPDYTAQAWQALGEGDHEEVVRQADACLKAFGKLAADQQHADEEITNLNAEDFPELNSVGTCLFILGRSLQKEGDHQEAVKVFKRLINDFEDARCKNEEGYFWKPAIAAQKKLDELESE